MGRVLTRTTLLSQPTRYELLPGGLAGIPGGLERLKNNQVSGNKLVALPFDTE